MIGFNEFLCQTCNKEKDEKRANCDTIATLKREKELLNTIVLQLIENKELLHEKIQMLEDENHITSKRKNTNQSIQNETHLNKQWQNKKDTKKTVRRK